MLNKQTTLLNLTKTIKTHTAMHELNAFGKNLKKRGLNIDELKILMATLWSFYKETPSGILSLSLRLYDFWKKINAWEAMEKSAYVLSTAVDEFGLTDIHKTFLPTHHQLFLNTAQYFKISVNDLISSQYTLPAGEQIGKSSFVFYRKKSLSLALGFHYASELTSWPEFKYLFEGFLSNKEAYSIHSENDPAMKFFHIHTIIEPEHSNNTKEILRIYLEFLPESKSNIIEGAIAYLSCYKQLFNSLNQKLFNLNR